MKHYGNYFKKGSHIIEQRIRKVTNNLSGGQCFVLKYLTMHSGTCNQNELETLFGLRRSSVTSLIKSLEENNYISRTSDEKDKRQKKLLITDKGKEINKNVEEAIDEIEEILSKNIPEKELEIFAKVSEQMMRNLKEDEK